MERLASVDADVEEDAHARNLDGQRDFFPPTVTGTAPLCSVTRVLQADTAAVEEAARVLRAGGLVALPTETVYGLAGLALSVPSLARIFAAKGRPATHPLICHVLGAAEAAALASEWPAGAAAAAARFWPGPLTLVVPRAPIVPAELAAGGPTVALRAPSHPVFRAVLAAVGVPLAAPSANRYQHLSPTLAEHVVASLSEGVDLVLDGGPTTAGIESSVVDVSGPTPTLLRPGAIAPAALREVFPDLLIGAATIAEDTVRASPGLDARHYAPRASLRVVAAGQLAAIAAAQPGPVGVVLRTATPPANTIVERLPDDPAGYAAGLFAALHRLDAQCASIVVESVPADDAWLAVADRLQRAAH
jgi:L-threonylcarbamoyladenylate synthase